MREGHLGAWATWIGSLIAAITAIVVVSVRFAALEEAKATLIRDLADQTETITRLESRIRAVETSNALEIKVNVVAEDVSIIRAQVQELREDIRRQRR